MVLTEPAKVIQGTPPVSGSTGTSICMFSSVPVVWNCFGFVLYCM